MAERHTAAVVAAAVVAAAVVAGTGPANRAEVGSAAGTAVRSAAHTVVRIDSTVARSAGQTAAAAAAAAAGSAGSAACSAPVGWTKRRRRSCFCCSSSPWFLAVQVATDTRGYTRPENGLLQLAMACMARLSRCCFCSRRPALPSAERLLTNRRLGQSHLPQEWLILTKILSLLLASVQTNVGV